MVAVQRKKTRGWGPATVDFAAELDGTVMVCLELGAAGGGAPFLAVRPAPTARAILPPAPP